MHSSPSPHPTPPTPALPPYSLSLIGIGSGDPGHLTAQARAAIHSADLILLPHKGEDKAQLAELRLALCHSILGAQAPQRIAHFDMPERDRSAEAPPGPGPAPTATDSATYLRHVRDWHHAIAQHWLHTIAQHLHTHAAPAPTGPHQPLHIALLIWGDPALYDSSLRIAQSLRPAPQALRVLPGISAVQALCAAHTIALSDPGQPFVTTTGRQLREHGWPQGVSSLVVLLDNQCSFNILPPTIAQDTHIWWGAYLGLPQQILAHGPLPEAAPRIQQLRHSARARHGWVMDIYLLRRQNVGILPDQAF